jgi:hypothetical protein
MVAKKTATKKPSKTIKTVKKVTKRTATKKQAPMKSFRIYKDDQPFTKPRVSRQTVYWIILLVFIVITQLWILKIQMDIANLTALLSV